MLRPNSVRAGSATVRNYLQRFECLCKRRWCNGQRWLAGAVAKWAPDAPEAFLDAPCRLALAWPLSFQGISGASWALLKSCRPLLCLQNHLRLWSLEGTPDPSKAATASRKKVP